ncbi:MAG: carbohydrate-binding domain-containing protein, partial [Eubacteriales bacterium]|nr:carbohydrate-binding domain-containing protein [Eubacteriales bacterium]
MFDKNKKLLIAGLSLMLVMSMTLTGTIVYLMLRDKQTAASGEVTNANGELLDSSSDENSNDASTNDTDITDSDSSAVDLTDEELLVWAEYTPTAEWETEDTDASWDNTSTTAITLEANTMSVSGSGAIVNEDGSIVTITEAGTYVISGAIAEGQVIVDAADEALVKLVLNNADITSSTNAPIFISNSAKTIIILAEGTENSVKDLRSEPTDVEAETGDATSDDITSANEEEENELTSAIYSKDDLSITGSGSLSITTTWSDGINGRDDLMISQATLNIEAGDDGINGRDLLVISSGTITITSGGDGIKSSNANDQTLGHIIISGGTYTINAGADGIQAAGQLIIEDGDFDIKTGEGSSQALADRVTENPMGDFGGGIGGGRGNRVPGGTMPEGSTMPEGGTMPESGTMPEGGMTPDANSEATPETEDESTTAYTLTAAGLADSGENVANDSVTTSSDSLKALKAATAIKISGGSFSINSTDDAIHSNGIITIDAGTYEMASGDDGIHADATVTINGGQITISKSYEGIEGKNIILNDGIVDVVSSDDGINIAGGQDASAMGGRPGQNTFSTAGDQKLEINGGDITVNAEGDGIDVNGTANMSGGTVIVYGPSNSANGALDYDGSFEVTGGTLLAVGSSGMAQSVSSSSQTVLAFTTNIAADTEMSITDSNDQEIISAISPRAFAAVIFTS